MIKKPKPAATQLVDGALWPAAWHVAQCPYAVPGVACELGGSPCQLEPGLKADMMAGHLSRCRHQMSP